VRLQQRAEQLVNKLPRSQLASLDDAGERLALVARQRAGPMAKRDAEAST
jgi:hypothetical protein